MESSQIVVIERLQQAQNARDIEAFLACIAPDYQSDQPLHPDRGFQGRDQVRKNLVDNLPRHPRLSVGVASFCSCG